MAGAGYRGSAMSQPDLFAAFAAASEPKSSAIAVADAVLLDGLNVPQREAVVHAGSPVLVVAGAGVPVAKHGNRAVSSQCGSADVLAALGVNIEAPPEVVEECLRSVGIGFLFAPKLHPAMKHAGGVRRPDHRLGVLDILLVTQGRAVEHDGAEAAPDAAHRLGV